MAQTKLSETTRQVSAIAFSPDGTTVADGIEDGQIALVDINKGKLSKTLPGHSSRVTGLVFSPNGKTLNSVGRDTVLRSWDIATGKQTLRLQGPENPPRTIAISQNGQMIATAGEDPKVHLWDVSTEKLIHVLSGHKNFVNGIAFNRNGKILASGDDNGLLILWDTTTGKALRSIQGHMAAVTDVAFSTDGKTLASVSQDQTARLWNVDTGEPVQVFRDATEPLQTVRFSPNGDTLIATGKNIIYFWNTKTNSLRLKLNSLDTSEITAIDVSLDGKNLATANKDGYTAVWDVESGVRKQNVKVTDLVPATNNKSSNLNKNLKAQKSTSSIKTDTSSFTETLLAAIPPATGGPILLVTSTANRFSEYYAEILRNEGLNYFAVSDISSVTSTTLANYDVVLLAEMNLSSAQVTTFNNWVQNGGNLIAMRPDKQLASLLGLTDANSTLSDAYLLVNNSTSAGKGIVNQTIQFHGIADRYTLNGADSIATLYTNATTSTSNPAVTLRSVGNGQAAAFTYDLARSIVYTRQGNPTWDQQERDGFSPIRSDDLFYGNASGDVKPDWVDLNKVAIPQADEQQRLLANLIINMNQSKKPLPRFWYFPHGKKAVVMMTGDDHANGGTAGRFDQFINQSPPGCSVDDWQCIRGTSYIYALSEPITNAQMSSYNAQGFEISLHLNTNCENYQTSTLTNPPSLQSLYQQQVADFTSKYPSLPAPTTQRHHCLVWSDWFSTPQVESNYGIRLDTTYYYWPPAWINNSPGFFTGSGMPMRFANKNGEMIDVYGAATQLTDESGQSYPYTIDTLLDRAIGTQGYYGVFNVNAHTDSPNSSESDEVVASAKARGVPVVSAKQVLKWLDGRNSSSFGSFNWSNNALNFTITKATNTANLTTNGLQAMLPTVFGNTTLSSLTRNGNSVAYTTQIIKGIEYAFFSGDSGAYVATYTVDTSAPTVTANSPSNSATGVSTSPNITASFSKAINPATVTSSTFELRDASNTLVPATVSYNAASQTATLTPSSALSTSTLYTATVKGGTNGVKDTAGNALAADFSWSFTTTASTAPTSSSIWNNSATPTTASVGDSNAVELGVKFRSDVDGYITGIKFYKGSQNTGTHIGNLWTSTGTKLATATFSNETTSGWQQVNFDQPVAITANTVYVASYHTNVGRYALNQGYFTNSGVNNPPLYALRNGENGGNGVYKYGATSNFPTDTYQSSNYWVDVVFTTSTAPDTTPPTVTANSPSNGATGVSTLPNITASFSEAINSATVTSSSFELRNASNTLIPATVSYNAVSRTATLTPSSALSISTLYTATVKGGANGIKDTAGNALAADFSWSFTTTASTAPTSSSIWNNSATPANLSDPDTSAVELGVKFRADVDGSITGIRFYKSIQNTGTHIGNLWSSSGQLLATATFTNETASGWQQVNFNTPVPITANSVYVASYHTNVGRYSTSVGYFANSGFSNPPLYALKNGESDGNGVYKYGASGFPTGTYQSTNYWVDVVFTPN
ncbi:DUF4082 domain-containing protein [Anabaena azotica]|uniref:DUF4082 domain-containing protein n=1 Tax=Anabaena azotica TaxID=197653 RepID=UPI0028C4B22B|nr:DUF4082 domain-containing protein [Anabaena azotica]